MKLNRDFIVFHTEVQYIGLFGDNVPDHDFDTRQIAGHAFPMPSTKRPSAGADAPSLINS